MNGSFFDKIGVADMEKVHSAVIGWVFSDECKALTNQQKSDLLCSLFGIKPDKEFNSFEIKVEHHDIDVLIVTDNDTCWVIENKVKSSQHSNQLDKYYDIINGNPVTIGRKTQIIEDYKALNKHFCYLTLVNEKPQCTNNVWTNTTYQSFSIALKDALENANRNNDSIILNDYLCCITNLSTALADFINNHQQYPYVFVDGPNKKKRTGNYIAENGLETIFQKCFLSHIKNKTENYKFFDISETHGVALAEKKDVRSVKGYKLGIQFQNGSFKAQILNENLKADAFWNVWGGIIKKTEKGVEINNKLFSDWNLNPSKQQKGSYFSISKKFPEWYSKSVNEIVSDWDAMYNECIKVLNELEKVIGCTASHMRER
jgi:hypothetical protein